MLPRAERIAFRHQMQPRAHVEIKKLLHDLRNLFVAHNRHFRICLDQIAQRGSMFHLHMLHDHIIQPAAAQHMGQIFQILPGSRRIDRVEYYGLFV